MGGTYQPGQSATSCLRCVAGSWCKRSASSAAPCSRGRYSNETDLAASEQCTTCPEGSYCSTQSTEPTSCSAGKYSEHDGQEACTKCAAGTFQDAEGATACLGCVEGYYCAEGAAAALPCPGGTTKRLGVVMSSKEDCATCGKATSCPVGSDASTNCSAGTYNAREGQSKCLKCGAGTFQDLEGTARYYLLLLTTYYLLRTIYYVTWKVRLATTD